MTNLNLFANRRIAATLFLGFSSGLPFSLITSTLQAWYTVAGVGVVTIGLLSLVQQPYLFKPLWAPIMDRFVPPLLGRRRGWVLLTQVLLIMSLVLLAFMSPEANPLMMGGIAFLVAIFSASQDISVDAYRTDVLRSKERGFGAAVFVAGYRIALLISGAIALILAENIGWEATYLFMSFIMIIGVVATFLGPEPERAPKAPRSLLQAVVQPFRQFMSRPYAIALLALVIFYKIGDAMALSLVSNFLIGGLHFSLTDVGVISKVVGFAAAIVGAIIGGMLMPRLGLFRSLFYFGMLQAVSTLSLWLLAVVGKDYTLLTFSILIENLAGGMGAAAFFALLMSLCDARYSATQFALLSAISSIGRVIAGPVAGVLVTSMGWEVFFLVCTIAAIPGLLILFWLRHPITIGTAEIVEEKS